MTKKQNKNINIKQLSEIVGVSPSTVSRILSGNAAKYRIAAATEKRVMEKAAELGYRHNYFAHTLNTGRTFNIGLIFANKIDSFLGSIMEGVESRLRSTKYQMVVATCENKLAWEQEEIDRMFYRQVDGIIIYPSAPPIGQKYPTEHLRSQGAKDIPLVVVGRQIAIDTDHVLFSDYEAGKRAAENFLASGCKTFAFITLKIECAANCQRGAGFIETLKKHGVPDDAIHVVYDDEEEMDCNLKLLNKIDGIWAVNTISLIKYTYPLYEKDCLKNKKLRSCGREALHDKLPYHIDTLAMPTHEMGASAAALILQRIDKADSECKKIYLPLSE